MGGPDVDAADAAELYRRAVEEFGARVDEVPTDAWHRPTPCEEWDVRALVNHLVGEDCWVVPLLAGASLEEVGDRFDGDLLGDDPQRAWREAAAGGVAAVSAPGALERRVHLSSGLTPAPEYAMQLFADHLVHAWDLSVAVGADDALPEDLVATCGRWFADRQEAYRQAGVIGPPAPVDPGADAQTRLLAAFGRVRPWST